MKHLLFVLCCLCSSVAQAQTVPLWTLGEQRLLVIMVKYAGTTYQPFDQRTMQDAAFGTTWGVTLQTFYRAASVPAGKTWFVGQVTPWLTLPIAGGCGNGGNLNDVAIASAKAAGFDTDAYNPFTGGHIAVVTNVNKCGRSTGGLYIDLYGGLEALFHEMGHNFTPAMWHSQDESAYVDNGVQKRTLQEYSGADDVMGNAGNLLPNAFWAERLGWRTPLVVTETGEYAIDPYPTSTGALPTALKIPLPNGAGLYVEYRTLGGVDYRMFPVGVKLHTGTLSDSRSSVLLDLDRIGYGKDYVLDPGQFYDMGDVRVTTLSADAVGARIRVTFASQIPPPPPPQPTLTALVRTVTELSWSNIPGSLVDIFRDQIKLLTTSNDGGEEVEGAGAFQVCGSGVCVGTEP